MGLLDNFNFDDPATMGLLSAGMNMIGNSGRGGNMNTAQIIAQGLGSGMQGMQGVQQARQLAAQLKQKQEHDQLVMDSLRMENQQKQQSFADQADQRSALLKYAQQRLAPQPQQMPAQEPQDTQTQSFAPNIPQSIGQRLLQPSMGAPAQMSIGRTMQPQPQVMATNMQPQGQSQIGRGAILGAQIKEELNKANYYESLGTPASYNMAQTARAQAAKYAEQMPKYANDYRVAKDEKGNLVNTRLADDGTDQVSPYGFADKLHFGDNGQQIFGVGEHGGKPTVISNKFQTPDSIASQATIRRGQDLNNQESVIPSGQVDNMAKMIAAGQIAPLSGRMALSPQGLAVMAKVAELNPAYSGKDFGTGAKAEKDFATGKQGNSVRSFNVALSHLDTLSGLADAMGNKDTQAINKIGNYFATQTGQAAPVNFEAAKKIVADEVVKAIVGSGGGVTDREEAAKTINSASSPAQLKGVIGTYKELMKGQLNGLAAQYKSTTGKDDFSTKYLSENARNTVGQGEQQPKPRAVSMQDIVDTARASGKTTAEVTAALKAKGYTIGGQ